MIPLDEANLRCRVLRYVSRTGQLAANKTGWLAMFLYFLVTLAFTWPLGLHLGTHIIGPFHGDNLEYVWKIWWVKHAWFDLRISPQVVPHIYWPYGYPLAYGEITPLHTMMMLPVNLLLGPVCTYNLAILLSTWLSGWFAFQWLLNLTGGRRGAAFVGGLIFAFCPYRMARIAGHLPLVSTEGFPLVLWGIERFWLRHRGRDAGLAAIGVAVSALSSWYYAFMLAVLAPLYWIVRARPWREWFMRRWFWTGMALSLLVVICVVAPIALWYAPVLQTGEAKIPLAEADFWSASVADFLLPNWRHPLWGESVRRALTGHAGLLPYEFLLMPGYTVLALALWKSDQVRHPARAALVVWTTVAVVLSLGPSLRVVPGWPARLPDPSTGLTAALNWLGHHSPAQEAFTLNTVGSTIIPLPALLIRWFMVAGTAIRSWGRFVLPAQLGLAALAALGLASPTGVKKLYSAARRRWLIPMVGLLVLFEFYTGPQALIRVGPRPVDEWLAQQPGEFAIVQMPIKVALSGAQMFYTRYHGKDIISGYGTFFPILFEQRYPELADFPNDASLSRLQAWPVKYVLVDHADMPSELGAAIERQPRLNLVVMVGDVDVYAIVAGK